MCYRKITTIPLKCHRALVATIGTGDLSLPAVVQSMVGSENEWIAVVCFCEEMMHASEAAEIFPCQKSNWELKDA